MTERIVDQPNGEDEIRIVEISARDCLLIRQKVLWPGKQLAELMLDDDKQGTHLGAYCRTTLVGVISAFTKGECVVLRKFAVLEQHQGKGIGTKLLDRIAAIYSSTDFKFIILDARVTAASFYRQVGYVLEGDIFEKYGAPYVRMKLKLPALSADVR